MSFDFSDVDYLSSALIGKLISLNAHVQARGGSVKLCSIRPEIMDVFHACKLDRIFSINKDVADASPSSWRNSRRARPRNLIPTAPSFPYGPNRGAAERGRLQDGALKVCVTQAPEKGKANKAIVEVLAKWLGVRKSQIELISGETASQKKFLVREIEQEELAERINTKLAENQ